MHKLPQPVKLWYLSSFFRHERAAGRPLPPVLAGRRRGARLRRPGGRRRVDPAARRRCSRRARACATCGCGCRASAARRRARDYRERAAGAPARARGRALRGGARRASSSTRCARSTPTTRARSAVMASAPRLLDHLDDDDREHFAEVRALLDDAGVAYEVDPTLVRGLDYYTRTVFEFTSDALGAQSGVGGGGRYDGLVEQLGGPPTPGMGWAAGIERILLAAPAPAGRAGRRSTSTSPTPSPSCAGGVPARRRRAPRRARAQMELGGRSLKGQLKQADRAGRPLRCDRRRRGRPSLQGHGDAASSRRSSPTRSMHDILRRDADEAAARQRATATPGPASCDAAPRRRDACASPAGCTAAATTAA